MKNLFNIASTNNKPLFIDPRSVTAIHIYAENKELSVFNEKGQFLWINYEQWGVDPAKFMEVLAAANNPLVPFPIRWPGRGKPNGKEYAHYIAPSAVTFATVTQVTNDGTLGAIIGVKGVGAEESYGTKPEELQALLDGVKAAGKNLIKYEPGVAHSRWYNAAALYIDPAAVREICDDGIQVNVYFDASGSLDVETCRYDGRVPSRENDLLNELLHKHSTQAKGASGSPFKDINDVRREVQRIFRKEQDDARAGFADNLAKANGSLTKIINTSRAIYVHPDDFAYISFYDDDRKDAQSGYKYMMILERQKTQSDPYHERVRAYFNSSAERMESFAVLTGGAAQPTQNQIKPAP